MESDQLVGANIASAPNFNPTTFSSKAATALQTVLEKGFYRDSLRLPRPSQNYGLSELSVFLGYLRKRRNCWGYSGFDSAYRKFLRSEKGLATVYLFDLFWRAQPIQKNILLEIIDENQFEELKNASVISCLNDLVYPNIRIIVVPHLFSMFDIDRTSSGNFVYFGTDSRDYVEIIESECAGMRFERSLDLCTGSGVQGLSLARQSEEVLCTDLNTRALSFVKANALLNKIDNVRTLESNLFSEITGRFDCITANTPYVPMPDDADAYDLPMRGGDLGIEFTFELLEQALDYLSPSGIAPIYTSDPIMEKGPLLAEELSRKFGHLPLDFTQINIFRSYPNTERQRQHFSKHKMLAFDDCVLVVRSASKFAVHKHAWHSSYYWRSRLLRTNYASDPAVSKKEKNKIETST